MKVEVEELTPVEKRVEVEVPVERVNDEIEEKYEELRRTAQVKGFRRGRAPRSLLERLFRDYVHEEVAKKLVQETLETALARKGIKPVVEPVLDIGELKPGEPYRYTVHVEIRPTVELQQYKGLEVQHEDREITEEDVEKKLAELRESQAVIQPPAEDRPVRREDVILVRSKIYENGAEIQLWWRDEEEIKLWEKSWIPGLMERLVGTRVGDEVTLTAAIPEDEPGAPESMRGKTLEFIIKIIGIKERILPELNDDFARKVSHLESLAELREAIRKSLTDDVRLSNRIRLLEVVTEALVKRNPIDVSPTLVKQEARQKAQDFISRRTGGKVTAVEIDRFAMLFENEARFLFQTSYLLEAVAAAEGLEVSEEELEKALKEKAEEEGLHPDKYRARLGENGMASLKLSLRLKKALDFVIAHAVIREESSAAANEEKRRSGK